jgi:hypothetical protein
MNKEIGKRGWKRELQQHIPNQHLPQLAVTLTIDKLLRPAQLDVHVRVDADQPPFVFRLAPFEPDEDLFVDAVFGGLLC